MKHVIFGPHRYHLLGIFAIILVSILCYSNTLQSPLVYDDYQNITANPHIRMTRLDLKSLYKAAFESPSQDRPVANISFSLNYCLGQYKTAGYHLVNITIHILNGILVFFLAITFLDHVRDSSGRQPDPIGAGHRLLAPLFAALIFVAHPVQTQAITYIVQRMTGLSTLFFFLSFLLYIRGRMAQGGWKGWALFSASFLSWVLALGSKQIAATLPIILLLYEWFFMQNMNPAWVKKNLRYFLAALALLLLMGFLFLGTSPLDQIAAGYKFRDFTMGERVLTQFRVVVFYITLLFYPHPSRLNLIHHITTSHSLLYPMTTLLSFLVILGLVGLAIYMARKRPLISFCIFWFFINLVMESSVFGLDMIYEHRLYLSAFGFALAVAYLLFDRFSKRTWLAVVISVLVCLALGTATYVRNRVWRDDLTLWTDVVSKNPQSYRGHVSLGIALMIREKLDEAIGHCHQAIRLKPDYAKAYINLGIALEKQGKIHEAISRFYQALRIRPGFAATYYNLGNALRKQGKFYEAIGHYREAIRINPDFPEAHNTLGLLLAETGRVEEALEHFSKAFRIKPDYAEAYDNLGACLQSQGRIDEAVRHYTEALRIKPDLVRTHLALAHIWRGRGRPKHAVTHYLEVLRIQPGHLHAHFNLGNILLGQGRTATAVEHYSEALRTRPDFGDALNNLAWVLATHANPEFRDGKRAVELAERACKLSKGKNASRLDTLAAAYAEAGQFDKARKTAKEAMALAQRAGRKDLVRKIGKRLQLYESDRPFYGATSFKRP